MFLRTLLLHGMPHFENMGRRVPLISRTGEREAGRRDKLAWRHLELIRRMWKGRLVLKGILDKDDARIARESGIDGIIVSNHGGRQLDGAVAPVRVLPGIAAQAGGMTVMMDSGVRRGTDVLKALALGAEFVFVGRPFLYAAADRRRARRAPRDEAPAGRDRPRHGAARHQGTDGDAARAPYQRARPGISCRQVRKPDAGPRGSGHEVAGLARWVAGSLGKRPGHAGCTIVRSAGDAGGTPLRQDPN